jgi:hypothetical protein
MIKTYRYQKFISIEYLLAYGQIQQDAYRCFSNLLPRARTLVVPCSKYWRTISSIQPRNQVRQHRMALHEISKKDQHNAHTWQGNVNCFLRCKQMQTDVEHLSQLHICLNATLAEMHRPSWRMHRRESLSLAFTSRWFLAWLTLQPSRWRQHVPPNVSYFSGDYIALYHRRYNSS